MFHTFAIAALLLLSPVNCQTSNGNLSNTVSPSVTPNTVTEPFSNTPLSTTSSVFSKVTSSASDITPSPSTVCYDFVDKCYTDITYSAVSVPATGSGSAYATSCANAQSSYSSAVSSWGKIHSSVVNQTDVWGATSYSSITWYKDASTLCDGHARVTHSPAIPLSSTVNTITDLPATTSVYEASMGWIFPISSPSCSINPSDCDPLYSAYTTSLSAWDAQKPGASASPQITESPMPPSCVNSTWASENDALQSSMRGCGPCTIFGQGVQLLYFPVPTTVSRDMCASTPSASLTWFGENAVSIYNRSAVPTHNNFTGSPPQTAVLDGNTLTSGTAYISIATVWTGDRCTASAGTPVTSAILAMPSESVLSLRYSQDHFEYFFDQTTVTGYPFNFADMNKPIPYSAWNGQEMCQYNNPYFCQVIYEDDFNPQLAIPPGIRNLNPEWETCQVWYGGLYDPPLALQPATAIATATLPGATTTTSAEPSSSVKPSVPVSTAQSETKGDDYSVSSASPASPSSTIPRETDSAMPSSNQASATITEGLASATFVNKVYSATGAVVTVDGNTYTVSVCPSGAGIAIGDSTITGSGPAATISGIAVNAASDGVVIGGSTVTFSGIGHVVATTTVVQAITAPTSTATGAVITIGGSAATAHEVPGVTGVAVLGSVTLSEGGPAQTLSGGAVVSVGASGVVVKDASTTVTQTFSSATSANSPSGSHSGSETSAHSSTRASNSRTTASSATQSAEVSSQIATTSSNSASQLASTKEHWLYLAFACYFYLLI